MLSLGEGFLSMKHGQARLEPHPMVQTQAVSQGEAGKGKLST